MINVNQSFQETQCPLCQTTAYDKNLYPATFNLNNLNSRIFSARRKPDRIYYQTVRCQHCGIVRAQQALSIEVLSKLYCQSQSTDAAIASQAAYTYGAYCSKYQVFKSSNQRILEIGCGSGYFLDWLLNKGYNNIQGIEPSQEAINLAGAAKTFIKEGMFEEEAKYSEGVDTICAFHVFDHLLDPLRFLEKVRHLLNTQGSLMMVMHDIDAPIAKILGSKCPMIDIEHPFLYTKPALKKLLNKAGFNVVHQFDVVNKYPLSYWAQLAPLPKWTKDFLDQSSLGNVPLAMALGNQGIIAVKV